VHRLLFLLPSVFTGGREGGCLFDKGRVGNLYNGSGADAQEYLVQDGNGHRAVELFHTGADSGGSVGDRLRRVVYTDALENGLDQVRKDLEGLFARRQRPPHRHHHRCRCRRSWHRYPLGTPARASVSSPRAQSRSSPPRAAPGGGSTAQSWAGRVRCRRPG